MGANPVDRGKPGSKLHLVGQGGGLPLTVVVTAANLADTTLVAAALDDVPPIGTPSGRRRGIRPRIARRGLESSARLGRQRGRSSGRCHG